MSETCGKSASLGLSTLGPLIGLVLVYVFFALIGPDSFTSIRTLETIARQTAIVGTAALGMTLVIILGGIDLSVGSIVAMTSVVVALVLNGGGGPAAAILMAMLAGSLTGLTSGTLITRLKVAPFIVTLGMLLLVRGVAKGLGREQKVDAPITWLVELLSSLPPDRRWMLVPPGVWVLALLALATAVVLRYTRLGAHIFSIGSNEKTARLCGVHVERVKVTVYTLTGALAGLTGVLQFSRLTVGTPPLRWGSSSTSLLQSLSEAEAYRGRGTVTGTLVGAFIMTVIRAGTSQMGLRTGFKKS